MRNPTPIRLLSLALATALAGCAAGGGSRTDAPAVSATPEKVLEARALERWKLLIAGQFAQAYDYLSPGFRQTVDRETYAGQMKDRPVRWKAARFDSLECPPDAGYCDVTIQIDYEIQSTLPGVGTLTSTAPVVERWIGSKQGWYFVPKEVARR